jgi:hypothetical protein
MKRIRWEVRFSRAKGIWCVYRGKSRRFGAHPKTEAVKWAVFFCVARFDIEGEPSELIIKNRDGRIGKGSGSRRSYGLDPRKSRG